MNIYTYRLLEEPHVKMILSLLNLVCIKINDGWIDSLLAGFL